MASGFRSGIPPGCDAVCRYVPAVSSRCSSTAGSWLGTLRVRLGPAWRRRLEIMQEDVAMQATLVLEQFPVPNPRVPWILRLTGVGCIARRHKCRVPPQTSRRRRWTCAASASSASCENTASRRDAKPLAGGRARHERHPRVPARAHVPIPEGSHPLERPMPSGFAQARPAAQVRAHARGCGYRGRSCARLVANRMSGTPRSGFPADSTAQRSCRASRRDAKPLAGGRARHERHPRVPAPARVPIPEGSHPLERPMPSGMQCDMSLRSGGIVALLLNRRLMAGNPPGSPRPGRRRRVEIMQESLRMQVHSCART